MSASTNRRQFLKYVGGSAALAGLTACGGGGSEPETPAAGSEPAPEPAKPATMPEAASEAPAEAPAAGSNLAPLNDDDPQAQALGYVSDATTVDATAQPRFEVGQACANCALFMGAEGDETGPCSIFPGRLVAATGWCSVYAPKA
jgi:hypothetical protein